MNEGLSALVDDALDDDAAVALFKKFRSDDEALRAWNTYHLIGDSIRGDSDLHVNVIARVMSRIESEPTVLAPPNGRVARPSSLRWMLPLAASVMGVGAVAWVAQSLNRPAPTETVARLVPPPVAVVSNAPASALPAPAETTVQAPDSGVAIPVQANFGREYLIAHQAYSPGAQMSGVAQYVRTVSESRDESAR